MSIETINESLKMKLQKLLTLSRRGVDGEKANAEDLLQKLLKKYGISLSQIDSETRTRRYYSYTTLESKTIVAQIMYHVVNTPEIYSVKNLKELCVDATDYENIQIKEMMDFHLDNFRKEKKKLLKDLSEAYVDKHNLYSRHTDSKKSDQPVDWERLERILRLSGTLENVSYHKKLQP